LFLSFYISLIYRSRRGPCGPRTLCNACGLVYAKIRKQQQQQQQKEK
jgi:hypothetical protein